MRIILKGKFSCLVAATIVLVAVAGVVAFWGGSSGDSAAAAGNLVAHRGRARAKEVLREWHIRAQDPGRFPSQRAADGESRGKSQRDAREIDVSKLARDVQETLAGLSGAQRELYLEMLRASRDFNVEGLLDCSKRVRGTGNADLKSAMVGALGSLGEAGFQELSNYLVDSDGDVVQSALDEFEVMFNDIDDVQAKIRLCENTASLLKDADAIGLVMVDMKGCDCDDPETAMAMVQSLNRMVGRGNELVAEAARETYEYITDQPYTTAAEAVRWAEGKAGESEPVAGSSTSSSVDCDSYRK